MARVMLKLNGPRSISKRGVLFQRGVERTNVGDDFARILMSDNRFEVSFDSPQTHDVVVEATVAAPVQVIDPKPSAESIQRQQIIDIAQAMDSLDEDNDSHYTKDGKPDARALTHILGWQVTSDLRDRAMEYQAKHAHDDDTKIPGNIRIVRKGASELIDTGGKAAEDGDPTTEGAVEVQSGAGMLLAPVAELRAILGFDDMPDFNAAAEAALHAATPFLSARIGTSFDVVTDRMDRFYVHEPSVQQGANIQTEFRLSQGLIKALKVVSQGATITAFDESEDVAITEHYYLDKEKGVFRDYGSIHGSTFVEITYDAGLPLLNGAYNDVPPWLKELALLQAQIYLSGHAVLEQAQIKIDKKTLAIAANSILASKVRYTPVALLPL